MGQGMIPGRLTMADRAAAADLLTEAFLDNPAHAYIYPDPAKRRRQLRWLMYVNLAGQLEVGQSFAEKTSDGAIAAMGFWHPPGSPKTSLLQLARFGFLAMPFVHGWPSFERMLKSVDELEERRGDGLVGRKSWYLNNMVVAAAHRGAGVGSRILRRQLGEVVDPSGYPASLTTQRAENVTFYAKLGFRVTDDRPIGHGSGRFTNWIMVYG